MTMTTPSPTYRHLDRHERIYRGLLVAYPRAFRDEYGEDLVQSFRDLVVFATDGRGVWWRTTRDLIASAAKERGSMLSGGGKRPISGVFVLLAIAFASLAVGPGAGLALLVVPAFVLVLIGLPTYGATRFRRAWLVRRTTGAGAIRLIGVGLASFVPAVVTLVLLNDDAGYFIFVAVALTAIVGSAMGLIWAVVTIATAGHERFAGRRWVRPVLVLVPCVAILGFIIGASYNSYRQSLGPAGDHSVQNASVDTRALWEAAHDGDVEEVVRITTDTCADPWVKFPLGNGRHNAKGQAEARELDLPDELEPPFREIAGIIGDYMDDWSDHCGRSE